MLDLSSFQSVEDSLKTPSAPQPESADIVDLSSLAPASEPTIGDKVITAAAKVKEGVGSLYDKVTGQESPEQVNIIPNRADSDRVKRQEMAKAKHLENLNTDMTYYLQQFKLGDPDALKLDPGTVAIQSSKRQQAEQGLDTSFVDPLMWPLENAVATGALKGLASVYDAVKMNKSVRTFMERLKPNEAEEMTNTIKFMEEHGISPTDALVQGSKGSDLGQFIGGHNVFGVRDAFNASETLANDYFKMVLSVTDKIKANGVNIGDIKTWKDITKAQKEVKEGVENLRKTYKDREAVAYSKVSEAIKGLKDEYKVGLFPNERSIITTDREQPLATVIQKQLVDEGVPSEATEVVKNIFNRFAKPYVDETKELAKLTKERLELQTTSKMLTVKQQKAINTNDTVEATSLESLLDGIEGKLKDLATKEKELKDVRYMNAEELMATVKLINRRLYKPGGAISLKDADELRGLQIAKTKIEDFLANVITDPDLKQKIRDAKDITIARTTLFGAKDMGGEKALLANILNQGDFTKIGKYLTGPEAKENIVFIRDTFGKDSEVYKTSLGHYLTDKLGMTPEGLTQLLDTKKVFGISDRVNLQQAAAKISTLDAQDFSLVRQVAGKDAALDLKSIQRLTQNFADLENAAEKYGRGITAGKLAYVEGDANILGMAGRGLKLVKDAVMYHSAKTAEQIIYNQPKFRTLTGALTGETIYLANNEDKDLTIEGILGSLVGGGVGGYYGGRATRSLLESDINKITRYLKSGAEFGENMPKGLIDSLTRLGAQARQFEGEVMDMGTEATQKIGAGNMVAPVVGVSAVGVPIASEASEPINNTEVKDIETKGKTTEVSGNGIEGTLATASSKASILKDLPIKKVEAYDKATEVFYRNKDAKGLAEYLNKIPDESYRQWFRTMAGIPEDTKITEASIKAAGK